MGEISNWSGPRLQNILSGHPKLLLNKGRISWGAEDQELFAPESEKTFQLLWLALDLFRCTWALAEKWDWRKLLAESLDENEEKRFQKALTEKNLDFNQCAFIPLHPWQWERFIQTQFVGELSKGELVFLGAFGDHYQPQISLRTLTNISRPNKMDIKLPLTILKHFQHPRNSGTLYSKGGLLFPKLFQRSADPTSFWRNRGCRCFRKRQG